jgi:hypothetical protein
MKRGGGDKAASVPCTTIASSKSLSFLSDL